jgi:hypothetical protein
MCRAALVTTTVAGLMLVGALSASADSLPTPRWDIEYDLTGTTLQVTGTPLGLADGVFVLWGKGTAGLGEGEVGVSPGDMLLEMTDCGGAICAGPTVLSSYVLETHFNAANVFSDFTITMTDDEGGNYAGGLVVTWTDPGTFHSLGDLNCQAGALVCGLGNLDEGANPIDQVNIETQGDFNFNIVTANPFDIFADWTLPADPSGATKIQHLRGLEVQRSLIPVPEPGTAMLFGLGLMGLALSRRRH